MALFEDRTPEGIRAGILADCGLCGLETVEGGWLSDMAAPVALELWKLYQAMNALFAMVYVDETSGPYIDMQAGLFGITRKAGTAAVCTAALTGVAGAVIPAGTRFLTPSGLGYTLDEAVALDSGGTGTGSLTAETVGEAYNVPAGTMAPAGGAIQGLTACANGKAQGGTEAERDEALLSRYLERLRTPATSGNPAHYRQWALEVSGVGDARVTRTPAGPGTVGVLIVDGDRQPVDASVVTACAAHIEEMRPIGAAVTVTSAEGVAVAVAAAVDIDGSTTKEAVRAALERSLGEYLKGVALNSQTVLYNRIAFLLMDIDGVGDYSGLTVNGGTGNVSLTAAQVPVMGTVTIT